MVFNNHSIGSIAEDEARDIMLMALEATMACSLDEWSEESLSEAEKFQLAEHDKKRHHGHFDPETMTCKFREQLKEGAKIEELKDEIDDIEDAPDSNGLEDIVAEKEEANRVDSEIDDIGIAEAGISKKPSHNPPKTNIYDAITPEMDKAYMDAVEKGDMETAQKLLWEAASIMMPNTKFPGEYTHSTNADFTIFNKEISHGVYGDGIYFYPKGIGEGEYGNRKIYVFLDAQNPFRFYKEGHYDAATKIDAICDAVEKAGFEIDRKDMHELFDDEGEDIEESHLVSYVNDNIGMEFAKILEKAGYDSLEANSGTEFIVLNPKQIKSSALIEKDDNGNIIPLSKRFDMTSRDIRGNVSSKKISQETIETDSVKTEGEEKHDKNTQEVLNKRAQEEYEAVVKRYRGTPMWMKAPNGEPTNLTEEQWVQVRTPSFKGWFGDWEDDPENASKIVDENGEPMVVYHGTDWDGDGSFYEGRTYFASKNGVDEFIDGAEGMNALGLFVNMRKPYYAGDGFFKEDGTEFKPSDNHSSVEADDVTWGEDVGKYLAEHGYDGIIDGFEGDVIDDDTFFNCAFSPAQMKSATNNSGAFNPSLTSLNE